MSGVSRESMAWRAAQDLPDGAYVNLGIGLPTMAARFVPADREIVYHSENGILGLGPPPPPGEEDADLVNGCRS
jgi:3-oxoacid CoA-transferase B subunit